MASSSAPAADRSAETEATVRQMLERAAAAKHSEPNSARRKDVLKRLIMHAKSPYSAVKRLVADNLRYFFKDFPQLEDDVINAVYDLCEDVDQGVRISGYRAIVELSREDPKWTKRNTDVLLQLLQSDDSIELDVITHALIDHINIDAPAALAVMCDHCIAQIHDFTLRRLVLDFFLGQGRQPILAHMRRPGIEAETVFVEGMLNILPRIPPVEAALLVERLLLHLRYYAVGTTHRSTLLASFMDPCNAALQSDLKNAGRGPISLPTALPTLETACKLPGAPLLEIFKGTLITRAILPRLEPKTQLRVLELFVATITSDGLSASERELALEEDAALVLETLNRVGSSDLKQVWPILEPLAQALGERGVPPPATAVPALRALQLRAEEEPRSQTEQSIRLIKVALNPPPVPGRRPPATSASSLKRKLTDSDEPPKPRGLFQQAIAQATNSPEAGRLTKRLRSASSSVSVSSTAPTTLSSSSAPSTPQLIRPLVARIEGVEVREGPRKSAPPTLLARMLGDGGLKARIGGFDGPRNAPAPVVPVTRTGSSLLQRMGESMQVDSYGSSGDVGRRKIRVQGRR